MTKVFGIYMNNTIYIKNSRLVTSNNLVRLIVDILVPNCEVFTVFFEVEEKYSNYLSKDRGDYLILLVLPLALKAGYDVYCELPISEDFMFNIKNILVPHLIGNDSTLKSFDFICETTNRIACKSFAVGAGVSGGVDSSYTILKYSKLLTHLFVSTTSVDLILISEKTDNLFTWQQKYEKFFRTYDRIGADLHLPIVKVFTNCSYFLCNFKPKKNWPFYFQHVNVHTYLTLCCVLSLRYLFRYYFFSAGLNLTKDFSSISLSTDPAHYELLLMFALSTPELSLYSGGGDLDRIHKIQECSKYEIAKNYLHPCFCSYEKNCSLPVCLTGQNKCLRDLLTLDYFDKLDLFSKVYDIDLYKNNQIVYFTQMVRTKDNFTIKPIYEKIKNKYPDIIQPIESKVTKLLSKSITQIEWNGLLLAYNITLKLLSINSPENLLISFFGTVSNIYIVDKNRLIDVIRNILKNRYNFYNYRTNDINNCDICFIANTNELDVELSRLRVKKLSTKVKILTFNDLLDYCNKYNK